MRYPGAKSRSLNNEITGLIHAYYRTVENLPYREPFFGSGGVGLRLMACRSLPGAVVNDLDPAMAAIWSAVLERPDALCEAIRCFVPSVDAFYRIKAGLLTGSISDPVELAVSKIAIHQISFSGLGTRAGGPLGGREQHEGGIDSRWNPDTLCREIRRNHRAMAGSRSVVTCSDFEDVVNAGGKAYIYLDPPYLQKGPALYQYAFSQEDHTRLANCLRRTANPWLLSYDDDPTIRDLYDFANVLNMRDLRYSIHTARVKGELLVLSANHPNLFDLVSDKRKYGHAGRDIFEE